MIIFSFKNILETPVHLKYLSDFEPATRPAGVHLYIRAGSTYTVLLQTVPPRRFTINKDRQFKKNGTVCQMDNFILETFICAVHCILIIRYFQDPIYFSVYSRNYNSHPFHRVACPIHICTFGWSKINKIIFLFSY